MSCYSLQKPAVRGNGGGNRFCFGSDLGMGGQLTFNHVLDRGTLIRPLPTLFSFLMDERNKPLYGILFRDHQVAQFAGFG